MKKQDFINSITQDIDIVRGDTLAFNFQLEGLDAGDTPVINLTCRDKIGGEVLFFITNDYGIELEDYNAAMKLATYSVNVAPNKTANLDYGRYYYDLQMTLNGDVLTLMRGRLTLVYEVTY